MALNKTSLEQSIYQAFKRQIDRKENPDEAIQQISADIANAIDTYIKAAQVTITPGISVQVAPTSGTGATISQGTGTIS